MAQIEIHDIGPVTEFSYDLIGPGIHVLRGKQGAGKTTILRTVQLATDGRTDAKPTKRDGTPRGQATIAGKTIKIAKQTREEGELLLAGLGDFNISDLHSPKYLDPVTRDKHRVKTLLRLCGASADASMFHRVLGNKETFDRIVPADAIETGDLVEMAARVKRAIEREAIRIEERAGTESANARAQAALHEGVDLSVESDSDMLQTELERALERRSKLTERHEHARRVIAQAEESSEKLEAFGDAVDLEEVERNGVELEQAASDAAEKVNRLESELSLARQALEKAEDAAEAAAKLTRAAKRNAELTAGWRADIEAAKGITAPTAEELEASTASVELCKKALADGAEVERARRAASVASEHLAKAQKFSASAKRLRDAAHDTANVLTDAIAKLNGCPLQVKLNDAGDPRLVLATDRSAHEAFDDLSDGERWPIILQLAATRNRLIVLHQGAYGELSPSTRHQLDELAKQHECYILTAVADDGELRGEAFASEVKAAE